ncbi:ATP-dependent zinc metalloprotease FtsH 3 [Agrobacterium rosae]|uniref:ATP-dependent zinc metalloprotease FtsH 3 n=1 Tax=Agrobacterium rosae TaxID=1972867 RepID=A0A1R3TC75_9HYPH|nr:ATP-dependent zinc metalloprotease FtsH 3 [Agrobacterium rosae]
MQNTPADKALGKRARSLWKSISTADQPDVTVPVHLAYCGIVAALRYYVSQKTSKFAILLVESPDALDSYVAAGRLYLRQLFPRKRYSDPFVRAVKKGKNGRPSEQDIFRRAAESGNGILFCTSLEDVDEELTLFVDLVATIPKPTKHQINATLRRFSHVPTAAEENMIANESWKRLVYAFQPERPVLAGLRRLRDTAQRTRVLETKPVASKPTLASLHGMGEAGEWGLELARDLGDFRSGLITWDEVDAGLLVSGAPGTGKTLFDEALANTCDIPIVTASAAQWQSAGYLNDFLKAMISTFEAASSNVPSILFVDEIDSFGSRAVSDHQNGDYKVQAINGFLEQLDGYKRRAGVVVIGATNYPGNLDPAITRPGRLDRHIVIPMPDDATRRRIFEQVSGITVTANVSTKFDRSTVGMSGASIKRMVRDAKRTARRQGVDLQMDHVIGAARPLAEVPDEILRLAAVHETGHAIVGVTLGLQLESISISDVVVTDGPDSVGGARFSSPPFITKTKSYYTNRVSMLLAGIAAEKLVFGEYSDTGAIDEQSDLAKATALATRIEGCLGFGDSLVVDIVEDRDLARLRFGNPSVRLAVQKRLSEAFETATSILQENNDALNITSHMLQRDHYLAGSVIEAVLRKN